MLTSWMYSESPSMKPLRRLTVTTVDEISHHISLFVFDGTNNSNLFYKYIHDTIFVFHYQHCVLMQDLICLILPMRYTLFYLLPLHSLETPYLKTPSGVENLVLIALPSAYELLY